jgi:hypothetical protein
VTGDLTFFVLRCQNRLLAVPAKLPLCQRESPVLQAHHPILSVQESRERVWIVETRSAEMAGRVKQFAMRQEATTAQI